MTRHVFTVNSAVQSLTLVFIWSSYLTAGSDVLREQQVWVVLLSLALEAANLWLQWILTVCRQYQVVALRMWRQCWQCSPVQSFSLGYHMMPVFGWWKLPWKQFLINVGKKFFLMRIFSKHSCIAPIPFLMVISFENKLPVLVKLKYKTFIPCIYHQIFFHVLQCKNHSVSKYSLHCEKARRTYLRQ